MHRFAALALALVIPGLAGAEVSTWSFDPPHTDASFTVKHMVIATVRGQFRNTAGTLWLDEGDITRSRVEVSIEAASVDTRSPQRDADLRSERFFDVAHHPRITFRSTRVEKVGDDRLKVTGELTIKGTTRPVTLDVSYTGPIKGLPGETRRGFTATGRLNRRDFGLNYSLMVEAGPVVSDEVKLEIDAEALKQAGGQVDAAARQEGEQEKKD